MATMFRALKDNVKVTMYSLSLGQLIDLNSVDRVAIMTTEIRSCLDIILRLSFTAF